MTVERTECQHRFLVQVAVLLLTGLILCHRAHRLHAGLLTKQKLLALLKASSQGTRDEQLAFLLLVLKQSQSQRGQWCWEGGQWQSTL